MEAKPKVTRKRKVAPGTHGVMRAPLGRTIAASKRIGMARAPHQFDSPLKRSFSPSAAVEPPASRSVAARDRFAEFTSTRAVGSLASGPAPARRKKADAPRHGARHLAALAAGGPTTPAHPDREISAARDTFPCGPFPVELSLAAPLVIECHIQFAASRAD